MSQKDTYPELVSKLGGLRALANMVAQSRHKLAEEIIRDADEIARKGTLTLRLYLGEDEQAKLYQINFSIKEARRFFQAVYKYLKHNDRYDSFVDTLGTDLENLVCGYAPKSRYQELSQEV